MSRDCMKWPIGALFALLCVIGLREAHAQARLDDAPVFNARSAGRDIASQADAGSGSSVLTAQAGSLSDDAALAGQRVRAAMTSGQRYTVSVTMKNTGSTTWTADAGYALGAQNPRDNTNWGIARVRPGAAVPPGQAYTFAIPVTAPAVGSYDMQWQMLQEYVRWFGATSSAPVIVEPAGLPTEPVTYIHTDVLGSPVARTDADGRLISRTRYEPYGATASGAEPTVGFTGHVNDADTGLVYMQQRYYDPVAGRFLSIDPVTADSNTGGSFNRYAYTNNSPYKYIDPDGRNPAVLPAAAGGTMVCGPICGGIAAGVVLIGGTYVAAKISNAIHNRKSDDAPKEARRPSRDVRAGADANATDSNGNLICVYCGEVMTTEPGHDDSREHDHVDPWADSHDSSAGNIVSGCKDCNRGPGGKGRQTPEQWGGKQGQFKDKPEPPPPPPETPAK
jgi:RHS repeat-associated protein